MAAKKITRYSAKPATDDFEKVLLTPQQGEGVIRAANDLYVYPPGRDPCTDLVAQNQVKVIEPSICLRIDTA